MFKRRTQAGEDGAMPRCPLCPRHCPMEEPSCGKGRRFCAEEGEGNLPEMPFAEEEDEEERPRRHPGGPGPRGGHGPHGPRPDGPGPRRRGPHGLGPEGPGPDELGPDGPGPHGRGPHGERPDGPPMPPFLMEEENELPGLLLRAGHHLLHRMGPREKGQNRILRILADHSPITQKELTDLLQIQPGSMSEILAKLENRGLLTREKDPEDRRRSILTLTEEGREKLEKPEDAWQAKDAFSCLTEEEQEELRTLLNKLLENWKAQA